MPGDSPVFEDESAMKVDDEPKNSNDEGANSDEEEGEEYEIEEILDAKRGAFPDGRMGYLVKWKGYGPSENSWVDELDTINAKELVDEFWRKNPRKGKRKSLEPKRARKSGAADEESDTNSAVKKRGRKSTIVIDSDADEDVTKTKKTKKISGKGKESQHVHDMAKYMKKESWEDLVDTVDTVERAPEGLVVYFTLKNGETIRERGGLCRERLPQKLLTFYESNLKWRVAESADED